MEQWIRAGIILLSMILLPVNALGQTVLRVGTGIYVPPFVVSGLGNHIFGFDIDLMRALCKETERECRFYPMKFDNIYRELKANRIDVAISAITITLAREEKVSFTLPYLVSLARYVVNSDSNITSITQEDLKGKVFGVLNGSIYQNYIQTNFPNQKTKIYERTNSLINALANDKVDIILVDAPTATFWVFHGGENLLLLDAPFQVGWGLGIAVRKELPELVQTLNSALLRLQASGKYLEIYKKYF